VRQLAEREGRDPYVLLAGGAAPKLAPHLSIPHLMVDNLVLEGLAVIAGARRQLRQPRLAAVGR
jgi:type III pantothenate kinase